ncbi:polysaccharide deacetylase family protein [Rugosimonospora africana]|uniref:Polysaccharide deacetylase n=1 Tax=Rugosimonospora africana TaxID=556532 RepID=A0A8J3VVR2_9ACTN|nr:polysaccharide deacetylase [Rugosimonospora africana]GIH20937.1 polysaccharide deacetylase [Rugosimonospora africana]
MTEVRSEPWQWDETTWRGHVELVQAGSSLAPGSWPNGARAAVAISFDSDHETPAMRDGKTSPGMLAQGTYGARVGVPRILAMLKSRGIPATFFMPAVSALLHPDEIRTYIEQGHEVALHGWIHERNLLLPGTAERELALRAADTLEKLTGVRPVGVRTPSWDFSANTLRVIRELGLIYDSSLMADDDPYELLDRGEPTGVVELPVDWIRDDAPYFMMDRYTALRPYATPRHVGDIWRDEFTGAYERGGIFQITLHPHIIGHHSRLVVLAELLDEITTHDDIWYATHAQLARYVRDQTGLD